MKHVRETILHSEDVSVFPGKPEKKNNCFFVKGPVCAKAAQTIELYKHANNRQNYAFSPQKQNKKTFVPKQPRFYSNG